MQISNNGIRFLQSWETLSLIPYDDKYGYLTIGWGHRIKKGESFTVITKEEADQIFLKDLSLCERTVNKLITYQYLSENQYDALISLAFNIGTGPKGFSGSSIIGLINSGQIEKAAEVFPKWNKSGGKVSNGLIKRRYAERDIFLNNHYVFTH